MTTEFEPIGSDNRLLVPKAGLHAVAAGALVFFTSAAVLVLEILGSRLLAPFIGVTLQTYTAVIGTILTGISVGTWLGGRFADKLNARSLLGPLLLVGGFAVLLTVPAARWLGPGFGSRGPLHIIALTFVTLFFPAAILSAINPTVVKLQLSDLRTTGSVVGRLSALGTAGAIIGTFATGFLLVATFPISNVIIVTGVLLVTLGAVLAVTRAMRKRDVAAPVMAGLLFATIGGTATIAAKSPCDTESSYYCIKVERDPTNANGRALKLDDIYHGYVDLANPRNLTFEYSHIVGAVVDHVRPATQPMDSLYVGGGSFTMPNYVNATRPESRNDVLEIDPAIVKTAKSELGLKESPNLSVHVGDARTYIGKLSNGQYDFVLGDAFGGESVPWQLTTREFNDELARVMKPDGVYVVNLIDFDKLEFIKAEIQTLRLTFPSVVLVGFPGDYKGLSGGNVEVVASRSPLDQATVSSWLSTSEKYVVKDGAELDDFVGNATALTDDFAPVDQLKTSSRFFAKS